MDEIFDALSNAHRRRLLVALLEGGPQGDGVAVPEDIHEEEQTLETLRSECYHSHLPRLEEAGFVRWNRETNQVSRGPAFDEIRPVLELIRDRTDGFADD